MFSAKKFTFLNLALMLTALSVIWTPAVSLAVIPSTFTVELSLSLCGEAKFENVAIDIYYSLGNDPTLYPALVSSQEIDTNNNTGTYQVILPSTLGTTEISLVSFCRNSVGFSPASNTKSVSNCDALALIDTDGDGMPNNVEDINCDNFFSPGDLSNPDNVDTDGDGVRDLVEVFSATDPTNPGSSPRPYVFSGSSFDPDGDGNSNPVAWRPSVGTWYVKDYQTSGNTLAVPFGKVGDIPISYDTLGGRTDVGVIRISGTQYNWLFHGNGFRSSSGINQTSINFGIFGDNIILGPWEAPGVTNPAVARLFNNIWTFFIYKSDGSTRIINWGGNGDIPKVQDYDGDGIFDIAVFRPSESKTYIIRSSDEAVEIFDFGSGTADHTVRGDYTGDGIDDISFWEPLTGMFFSLTSDNGFDDERGALQDPNYYFAMQLGTYYTHVPLSWNKQNGVDVYTVVDHSTGNRQYRPGNSSSNPVTVVQWGLPGDSLM